ncbi:MULTISPECIES: HMG-box domain-containing protein [Myroides]|uniref:HEPN domain-containing protein n=1 Tax=Myroides odoratimimus CCUG 10230 TaxID=883150 RepID=A0ABN0E8L0_9FLAO|nr:MULTISPECIES: hypothetical protein [Myroides]EHO07738.1 hypothetical protein HMPREF9712_02474 [Myroides odoratimimus CCUG 10230]MDM1373645.1 hypothetical protein [Myroides marinus]
MKSIINKLASLKISSELRHELEELIEKKLVGYIFYSKENLLNHPIVTLCFYDTIELNNIRRSKWITKGINHYQVNIYCLCIKDFYQSDSFQNIMYSTLNCQKEDLVYGSLLDSEPLFNLHRSKQEEIDFEKFVSKWFIKLYKRNNKFLKSLKKELKANLIDEQSAMLGIKQVIQDTKERVQPILSGSIQCSTASFLNFVFSHCSTVQDIFKENFDFYARDMTSLFREELKPKKGSEHTEPKEKPLVGYLLNIAQDFLEAMYVEIPQRILSKYKLMVNKQKLLSLNNPKQITEIQEELEERTRKALEKYKKVESFYLISRKTHDQILLNYENPTSHKLHLLLLASIETLHINEEGNIRQYVTAHTDDLVDVTVILIKKSNWHLHIPVYHSFFKQNITEDKLWIGAPLIAENPDLETFPISELKLKFWSECKAMVKPIVKRLSYQIEGCQSDADIIFYKYTLQQLSMAILFAKMDFMPQVHTTSYLWRLIQWYAPELGLVIDCNKQIKEMLFENYTCLRNYPNIKYPTVKYTEEQWNKVYYFIIRLYNFTKECYQTKD